MKKLMFTFSLLVVCFSLNAQTNKLVKPKKILLGKIDKTDFSDPDFSWFQEKYDNYLTNDKVLKKVKDSINNYSIKVFLGTWCGDSRRNVPPFYKVLEQVNFNMNNLEVIGVNKAKEAKKQSPNREEKGLYVHRVPTFIFYKNGKEVNRIIETPKEDFERDILKIVSKENYYPNYQVANFLTYHFDNNSIDKVKKLDIQRLANYVKGAGELNTFGYVLLSAKEYEKAIFVLELNTKIFSSNSNVFDSLGEAYFESKEYEKSLASYTKALSLNPDEKSKKHIGEMILKIKISQK